MEEVSTGQHLNPPEGCPDAIKCLMLECWEELPKDRITFKKIVETLSDDNFKLSIAHSNPSYGMTTSEEPTKSLETPTVDDNPEILGVKKKKLSILKQEYPEKPVSWPKLSNFSQISTSSDTSQPNTPIGSIGIFSAKNSICEESDYTKSIPSKTGTEYTIILPETDDSI